MKVREPSGPVQLQPPGLLGLLQLKVGGFVPDALEQSVQPGLEMEGYWLRAAQLQMTTNYARNVAGPASPNAIEPILDSATASIALGPTAREWWYVHDCVIRIGDTGGAPAVPTPCALGYTLTGGPFGGVTTVLLQDLVDVPGATYWALRARGFWVPPGGQIGVWFGAFVGPMAMQLTGCVYTPCPV